MSGAPAVAAVETVAEDAARRAAAETAAAVLPTVAAAEVTAAATVDAAQAATALAHANAAQAEIMAAERMSILITGLVTWQTEVETRLAAMAQSLVAMQAELQTVATLALEVSSVKERLLLIQPAQTPEDAPAVTVIDPAAASAATPSEPEKRERRRWT